MSEKKEKSRLSKVYSSLVDSEGTDEVTIPVNVIPDEQEVEEIEAEETVEVQEVFSETEEETKIIEVSADEVPYSDVRQNTYGQILSYIDESEKELADLKFRKTLMEADFPELLQHYLAVFVTKKHEASTIAKEALLEYFTYEIFKPLEKHDLYLSDKEYALWQTKNFALTYELKNDETLSIALLMPRNDNKNRHETIDLMEIYPKSETVVISDTAVLTLLIDCFEKRIFTTGQISFFSFEINDVLANIKELGFTIKENLLDNRQPLDISYTLPYEVTDEVLDDIFITAMGNQKYDFQKTAVEEYLVKLENKQTVAINRLENKTTTLKLDTYRNNKSLIEFFGTYPFLVPLAEMQGK